MIGPYLPSLDYADENMIILHNYLGIFIYDLNEKYIISSMDLDSLKMTDSNVSVRVNEEGTDIYIMSDNSDFAFCWNISSDSLQKKHIPEEEKFFAKFTDNLEIEKEQGEYTFASFLYSNQAVVFEDCTFTGLPLDQFKIATNGCDDITYTNCTFTGLIMINNCDNRDAVNTFNNCSFGLTEGFKVGYVNCMAATSIFNQCTFDYTGGSNMNMGVTKLNAVNAYSENTTYVELNGCVRNNCTTYANTSNSTLVVR